MQPSVTPNRNTRRKEKDEGDVFWSLTASASSLVRHKETRNSHNLKGEGGWETWALWTTGSWVSNTPLPCPFWCLLALFFFSDRGASIVLAEQSSPKLERGRKFWAATAHPGCMLVAPPELGPRRLLSCSAARAHQGSVDAWQFVPYSGQCKGAKWLSLEETKVSC